mmetsp:Transcript_20573/g.57075  ORF Transcript_20573/g.57075 Transcript_20573/m.57075 type:complete len:244 (+) Transcript_20573:118-849(+)
MAAAEDLQQHLGVVDLDGLPAGGHNVLGGIADPQARGRLDHLVDLLQPFEQLVVVGCPLLVLVHQLPVHVKQLPVVMPHPLDVALYSSVLRSDDERLQHVAALRDLSSELHAGGVALLHPLQHRHEGLHLSWKLGNGLQFLDSHEACQVLHNVCCCLHVVCADPEGGRPVWVGCPLDLERHLGSEVDEVGYEHLVVAKVACRDVEAVFKPDANALRPFVEGQLDIGLGIFHGQVLHVAEHAEL